MSAARRAVVVGGGVFGATGALELRRREWDVTLLDPHVLPSEGASSTDVSKLVRTDYGSDAFYHELAEEALAGWERWNEEWPRPLYHADGLLVLSRGAMTPGGFEHESRHALAERGHAPERLDPTAIAVRFPVWRAGVYGDGYFNARAGWVESGAVVEWLVTLGAAHGVRRHVASFAGLLESESCVGGVRASDGATLEADRVVMCAGAWTPKLLPWLSDRLHATAQPVLHFAADDPGAYRGSSFPPWLADIAGSGWYGFPALPDGRVKIGHHGSGTPVDPDQRGEVAPSHVERARAFLRDALPGLANAPLVGARVCLYCDTASGDFLIDADPDREGLIVASGGSGHAFKFAPVLGALIADATEGRSSRWSARFAWSAAGRGGKEAARFEGQ